MGFGALRCVIPISRTILSYRSASPFSFGKIAPSAFLSPVLGPHLLRDSVRRDFPWIPASSAFLHSLTDTRLPKRRPVDKPRRKRAGLRPPGPYAWVKYDPGKPSLPTQPNQGIVKRRNEKKRMKQKHTFIMAEKRKRKVEMQEAKRKKIVKRVERKMAAVARDRVWAQRLAELQQLEEEKKAATS